MVNGVGFGFNYDEKVKEIKFGLFHHVIFSMWGMTLDDENELSVAGTVEVNVDGITVPTNSLINVDLFFPLWISMTNELKTKLLNVHGGHVAINDYNVYHSREMVWGIDQTKFTLYIRTSDLIHD